MDVGVETWQHTGLNVHVVQRQSQKLIPEGLKFEFPVSNTQILPLVTTQVVAQILGFNYNTCSNYIGI